MIWKRNTMEVLKEAARRLESRGLPASRLEAEILMAHMLGCQRHELYLNRTKTLNPKEIQAFTKLIDRRCQGTPIQYITGRQEFMGLEFAVDERVLIPRGDTEILVEHVMEYAKALKKQLRILDVGTGSGAIAVSLAYLLPDTHVTAVDIDSGALRLAAENARWHGVGERIRFLQGDALSCLNRTVNGMKYDVLVSNPPYIPAREIPYLEPQVRDWEPRRALDGGDDGLKFYRSLAVQGLDILEPSGLWTVEVGYNQAGAVKAILRDMGYYKYIEAFKDLSGIDRVVSAIVI